MPPRCSASPKDAKEAPTATLGFEQKLWLAAGKLRNDLDGHLFAH